MVKYHKKTNKIEKVKNTQLDILRYHMQKKKSILKYLNANEKREKNTCLWFINSLRVFPCE